MTSTGFSAGEKGGLTEKTFGQRTYDDEAPAPYTEGIPGEMRVDSTHRRLKARHIQLIGIGG